jgi:hypothetical protein
MTTMQPNKDFEAVRINAPADFWQRLDQWRERQPNFVKPSRPATIRWIVDQFLVREQQRQGKRGRKAAR